MKLAKIILLIGALLFLLISMLPHELVFKIVECLPDKLFLFLAYFSSFYALIQLYPFYKRSKKYKEIKEIVNDKKKIQDEKIILILNLDKISIISSNIYILIGALFVAFAMTYLAEVNIKTITNYLTIYPFTILLLLTACEAYLRVEVNQIIKDIEKNNKDTKNT